MTTREEVYDQVKCEEVTHVDPQRQGGKEVSTVEKFFDLVTDFYEIGWGSSFHFAPMKKGDKFKESILEYELHLARSLGLEPGMKAFDAGCGVGGPMMNIAKASGADITGITICDYQIGKGKKNVEEEGLSDQCNFIHGNFKDTQLPDESFDAVYAIEATCHAPNKTKCFKEMHRILKKGKRFGGYEWCVTDKYDSNNPEHRRVIRLIEETNQIQPAATFEEVNQSLKDAGFKLLEGYNACGEGQSWSLPLKTGIRRKRVVRMLTDFALKVAERFNRVPEGSCQVASYLEKGAAVLLEAEEMGIFTPCYFFLAEKPEN